MRILLVEDDHLQSGPILERLTKEFPDALVTHLRTECDFRDEMPKLEMDPPDVAIVDVMLPWTRPRAAMVPMPPDVADGGYAEGGLRCARLLKSRPTTARVKIIIYSMLDPTDLKDKVAASECVLLEKGAGLDTLIAALRQLKPYP